MYPSPGNPVMKAVFPHREKLHRENPVLALNWPCTGLQCSNSYNGKYYKKSQINI
jgi:hypothetical protein